MIKLKLLLTALLLWSTGCGGSAPVPELETKFVPDRTPYIAGLIEATDDTIHHFPEVVVGYFSDPLNPYDNGILDPGKLYPALYNTTLMAQLTRTSRFFGLVFEAEANAKVIVRGLLDSDTEQAVTYIHIGNGVYGDSGFELNPVSGRKYRLSVQLPDGRRYQATTNIPENYEAAIPDSIGIEVQYSPLDDGTPSELHVRRVPIVVRYPEYTYLLEIQQNSEHDRELLFMESDEEFRFADYGPYLRSGTVYGVGLVNTETDTLTNSWGQRLDKPKENIWMKSREWYRISFFSEGIGGNFFALFDIYTANDYYLDSMNEWLFDAYERRDSSYLSDVSTIQKVEPNGEVLPKDSSDAIGFFGGYFSVYRQTTLYPIRNFDLDSVLARN